jgi:hypothetical protein
MSTAFFSDHDGRGGNSLGTLPSIHDGRRKNKVVISSKMPLSGWQWNWWTIVALWKRVALFGYYKIRTAAFLARESIGFRLRTLMNRPNLVACDRRFSNHI